MSREDAIRYRIGKIAAKVGGGRELARRSKLTPSHVNKLLNGTVGSTTIETLEKIAAGAKVQFAYISTGMLGPAEEKGLDLESHPHADFPQAARAFLLLYALDDEAVAVVDDALAGVSPQDNPLAADDWFDALRGEYRRRKRKLSFSMTVRK